MSATLIWFSVATTMAGILAAITIWAPRSRVLKTVALTCVCVFLPAAYASLEDMLSRPRHLTSEQLQSLGEEASVLASQLVEDEAIYLWLSLQSADQPRYFRLPWNDELARQLHEASRDAEGQGTDVKISKMLENSTEHREPIFYAAAPPPLPAKQPEKEQPLVIGAASAEN